MKNVNGILLGVVFGVIISLILITVASVSTFMAKEEKPAIHDTVIVPTCFDSVDVQVKMSVYQPDSAQCGSNLGITADGSKIHIKSYYSWCAVSRDLMFSYVNFGDTIIIETPKDKTGHCYSRKLVVKDNMGPQARSCIDVLVPCSDSSLTNSKLILGVFFPKCKITKIIRK